MKPIIQKRILLSFVLFFICLQMMTAQNVIAGIRQRYASAKERIETMKDEPRRYYEATVLANLPGTGPHKEDIQMFHCVKDWIYNEDEDEFSDVYHVHPPLWLNFVTVKYNFAARDHYEEYLFDKDGKLEFFYALYIYDSDDSDHEYRFYYKDGKPFQVNIRKRPTGSEELFVEEYSGKPRSKEESQFPQYVMLKASRYLHLFEALDDAACY